MQPARYTVSTLDRTTVTNFRQLFETYDLSTIPESRIKKIVIWLLKKIGAKPSSEKVISETFTVISTENLRNFVEEAVCSIYNQYGEWPVALLVGRAEQRQLYGEALKDPLVMDYTAAVGLQGRFTHYQGMKIILVPWMDGILPMLSLEDLNK